VQLATRRLTLVAATAGHMHADLESREALARSLRVAVPDSWPPDLYDHDAIRYSLAMLEDPANDGWSFYYVVTNTPGPTLVGLAGYKGHPTADGTVEIGYGILPAYQRRGFATEAAGALITNAFRHDAVRRVIAETLPDLDGSKGVLRRCGFAFVGDGSEPGVIRFALERGDHERRLAATG
jgi:RimJ/RimL family protein N-acetyltransferase